MNFYYPLKPTRISIDSTVFQDCEKDANFVAQRKKDGWRVQIHKLGDEVTIFTRHNKPLPPMISDVDWDQMRTHIRESLKCNSCIIDGEFLHRRTTQKETFYLWDLFELDGKRLRLPYEQRKRNLYSIVTSSASFQVLEDYPVDFQALWKSLDRTLDEGIVIKDLREPLYVSFSKTIKSPRQYKILLDDPRNQGGADE